MKWKQVAATVVGVGIVLTVFLLILSRVPLQVRISGGQLEVVRVVEMTVTPTETAEATASPTAVEPTATSQPTTRPSPTLIASATPVPSLPPVIIDPMEEMTTWTTYGDEASTMSVTTTSGITGNAVEITFELQEWGWMGLSQEIDPQALQGTTGIRFFHRGNGAPNTIEFKVLYAPNAQGESAIFSVLWPGVTATENWESLEVRYDDLSCWEETPCEPGETVDPAQVWKIDFAVSNKAHLGDEPGAGVVVIDEVQGVR